MNKKLIINRERGLKSKKGTGSERFQPDILHLVIFLIIRSQEKNLNQNRDSNLGPPDVKFPKANKLWV
jgi:hypothetical protein